MKGVGNQSFYRWTQRDYLSIFPKLPEPTKLFRLFLSDKDLTEKFLADPMVMRVIDSYNSLIYSVENDAVISNMAEKGYLTNSFGLSAENFV